MMRQNMSDTIAVLMKRGTIYIFALEIQMVQAEEYAE